MSPFQQFRVWLKEAPRAELWFSGIAFGLAMTLLSFAVLPESSGSPADLSAGALIAVPDSPGAIDPTTGSPFGVSPGSTPGASFPTITSTSPTGTTPPVDGQGSTSPNVPFTASDRGVTPDSIKLGFTILNLAGVEQAGYAAQLRSDVPQVIDALVEEANKNGGVLGRQIEAVKKSVDILSADDQRRKCLEFTQTDKVFAVIDSYNFAVYESSRACFAVENQTPLLINSAGSSAEVRKTAPYVVSDGKTSNRAVKDLVYGARANGFFDSAKGFRKLGLLTDSCDVHALESKTDGLKQYLREVGVDSWSEYRADCDISSQQRGGAQAVLQHVQDDVTHVMLLTIGAGAENYLRAANAQLNYRPKYWVGDFKSLSNDGTADSFNPDQFDRTRAVTQLHEGERVLGKPFSRTARECSQIFTDRGLAPVTDYSFDSEVLYLCAHLKLFIEIASNVGPHLTRPGWGDAVSTVGKFRSAWVDLAIFDEPGKQSGGDTVATIEWRRECVCWVQIKGFRSAYG